MEAELARFNGSTFVFRGEMVYPWMFEDYAHLRSLAPAANILAEKTDWPTLYDPERLSSNTVPCAALIYDNDMYVERRFSVETAECIAGMKTWITNEYEHNGLRADGARIFTRLLDLMHGIDSGNS